MKHGRIKVSLLLNYFIFAILLNSVGTVILEVVTHYGVSKSSAGNLDAFKDITIAVFSFISASFLPRLGYKISMLLGLAIISIASLLTPYVNTYVMIKMMLVSVGVGFALVKVCAYSIVGLITEDEKQHASFVSVMEGTFMFGVLFGFWLFSAFIHFDSVRWIDAYWVIAGLAIVAFILLSTAQLDEHDAHSSYKHIYEDFLMMLRLNKEPLIMVFVISIFMYVFIEQGITTWLPTFNYKVLHISTSMSIQMASIFSAALGTGRLVAGYVLKKYHWFWVLVGCILISGIMVLVVLPKGEIHRAHTITSWSQVSWAGFAFPMIGFFLAPIYPTLCSTMVSALPKRQHSAMMGLIMIFSALGGTLGSKLVGVTFQFFGGRYAIITTLLPMTILLLCLPLYKKLRAERKQQEPIYE